MSNKKPRLSTPALIPHPNPPTLVHGQYTREQLRSTVAEKEFCIITNVLSDSVVTSTCNGLKKAYESIFNGETNESMGFSLDDVTKLVNTPPYKGNGIVAAKATAGLVDLVALKLNADVSRVYELYYGCTAEELATSNDRFGVMLPSNEKSGLAPHIDANPCKESMVLNEDMLQGFVVLQDSLDESQGFVIYPGHARNPGKWAKSSTSCKGDFYLLDDDQKERIGRGYVIAPPAGSMVVWLSSAVHANSNGKGKKQSVGRIVAYIAKYPWSLISDEAARALETAIVQRTTLGHNTKRPSPQQTSGFRFAPQIDWQFKPEFLSHYGSVDDIPRLLKKVKD